MIVTKTSLLPHVIWYAEFPGVVVAMPLGVGAGGLAGNIDVIPAVLCIVLTAPVDWAVEFATGADPVVIQDTHWNINTKDNTTAVVWHMIELI